MIERKGLIRHDPENGQWGDCFRTCVACILDMEPEDVPHFADGGVSVEQVEDRLNEWLRSQGLQQFEVAINGDASLSSVAEFFRAVAPHTEHCVLTCKGSLDCSHCVVLYKDGSFWDPSPIDSGVTGPAEPADGEGSAHWWLMFLAGRI